MDIQPFHKVLWIFSSGPIEVGVVNLALFHGVYDVGFMVDQVLVVHSTFALMILFSFSCNRNASSL